MTTRVRTFTSAAVNYLPKARTLARSIKNYHPEFEIHLALADKIPGWFNLAQEPFDSVVSVEELDIPRGKSWIFQHNLVELSTAIKPFVLASLLSANDDIVLYFDPDIALFSQIDDLVDACRDSSILLTPHVTEPETSIDAILDNEVGSLRHGIYNLGFIGVHSNDEGRAFAEWWSHRTYHFCREARSEGLFTDQKWVDLAPAFFENIRILRDPRFNVAPWNLTNRNLAGSPEAGVFVDGHPLGFYHFTGFDSGDHERMTFKYAADNGTVRALIRWYRDATAYGSADRSQVAPWAYGRFDDGEAITDPQRLIYRLRQDLQEAYPDPFSVTEPSYRRWFETRAPKEHARLLRELVAQELRTQSTILLDLERSSARRIGSYVTQALSDRRAPAAMARRALTILRAEGLRGLRKRLR